MTRMVEPIFPRNGSLDIYANKTDQAPRREIRERPVLSLDGDWKACVKASSDGWVRCSVEGTTGWVKRDTFRSAGQFAPVEKWPFRYWLHLASSPAAGEGYEETLTAARTNPYLVKPAEFENIFFHVRFDQAGRAIGPHTHRPTGDRVFVFGNAVYLAPEAPEKRNGATWIFLNFYNEQRVPLCPSVHPDSCLGAVNMAPNWPGIKALHEAPPPRYKRKDKAPWFGATEVAFARHGDPSVPLMYRVPMDVPMHIDTNPVSDAQLAKNREKLFCIADCANEP